MNIINIRMSRDDTRRSIEIIWFSYYNAIGKRELIVRLKKTAVLRTTMRRRRGAVTSRHGETWLSRSTNRSVDFGSIKMVQWRKRSQKLCAFSQISYQKLKGLHAPRHAAQGTGRRLSQRQKALALSLKLATLNCDTDFCRPKRFRHFSQGLFIALESALYRGKKHSCHTYVSVLLKLGVSYLYKKNRFS